MVYIKNKIFIRILCPLMFETFFVRSNFFSKSWSEKCFLGGGGWGLVGEMDVLSWYLPEACFFQGVSLLKFRNKISTTQTFLEHIWPPSRLTKHRRTRKKNCFLYGHYFRWSKLEVQSSHQQHAIIKWLRGKKVDAQNFDPSK